jgi:hypothetical protein
MYSALSFPYSLETGKTTPCYGTFGMDYRKTVVRKD